MLPNDLRHIKRDCDTIRRTRRAEILLDCVLTLTAALAIVLGVVVAFGIAP